MLDKRGNVPQTVGPMKTLVKQHCFFVFVDFTITFIIFYTRTMHKTAFKMQHETGLVFIITSKWPVVTNNCCLNKSNAISFCYITSNSTIDTNTEGSFRRNEEITIIPFRRKNVNASYTVLCYRYL